MPSVAWFPLAILLFKLTDAAIMFVIVLGAAPSIANGLIHGVDHVPPIMLRAGRVLGAKGFSSYRYVILPAALPSFTAGLKQGWAFSWRSLMAGELLVVIAKSKSLGFLLASNRDLLDAPGPDGHDDRHPRHRHPRRRPVLLADREAAAPALGPRPGLKSPRNRCSVRRLGGHLGWPAGTADRPAAGLRELCPAPRQSGQWGRDASGSASSLGTSSGRWSSAMSATVTCSSTARRLARTASQTSRNGTAAPS